MSKAAQAVAKAVAQSNGQQTSRPDQPNQLLPEMQPKAYEAFKQDIRERGILVPVEIDQDGNILDGHHRARVAAELGIAYPTVKRTFTEEHEKRLHIVSLNAHRRHLTDMQRVRLGEQIEGDVAERARRRKLAALGHASESSLETNVANGSGRTVDEVAEIVGLGSGKTYERDRDLYAAIREKTPELVPRLESGELDKRRVKAEMTSLLRQREVAEKGEVPGDDYADVVFPVGTDTAERKDTVTVSATVTFLAENPRWRTRVIDGEERSYRRESIRTQHAVEFTATSPVLYGADGLAALCDQMANEMHSQLTAQGWPVREGDVPVEDDPDEFAVEDVEPTEAELQTHG